MPILFYLPMSAYLRLTKILQKFRFRLHLQLIFTQWNIVCIIPEEHMQNDPEGPGLCCLLPHPSMYLMLLGVHFC